MHVLIPFMTESHYK